MDLDAVAAGTGDGVCVIDGRGRITRWNAAAERLLGHARREVLGRPCHEVFGGRDAAGNRLCYPGCHVRALVGRNEPVQHFDMATRTKTGKPVWLDVSILAVRGARDEESVTVQMFRDVTSAREIETLVRSRLAQAAGPSPDGNGPTADLTRRELQVLRLMASGTGTPAMAESLHVSRATVRNHVQNILAKLGAHSRLEAVALATRHRLA
jgi:PAS domain S-box-containing protein